MKFVASVLCVVIFCYQLIHKVESLDGESIISGILTPDDDLQYMVALFYKNEPFCAGGIIGDRYILTAAHCVIYISKDKFRDNLDVLAGTHDLLVKPWYDNYGITIKVAVEKIFVPLIYSSSVWGSGESPKGDIAVLKLKGSLQDLPKLKLPPLNKIYQSDYNPYDGEVAQLGGFGYEQVKFRRSIFGRLFLVSGYSSRKLHHGNVRVVNFTECQKYYTSHIWDTKFCGKMVNHGDDTPQGACMGDSGSPLVIKGHIVIGVLTGAQSMCDENEAPSQYTNLLAFREFVQNAMDGVTSGMQVHEVQ